jgi:hypothetical protein
MVRNAENITRLRGRSFNTERLKVRPPMALMARVARHERR